MEIKFNDGISFETDGAYRIEARRDGLYVVGYGCLIPVNSREEGNRIIASRQKPYVKLIGEDGNAFFIIVACKLAWERANKSAEEWKRIKADMMSGDYDHLLQIVQEHFEVR